MVITADSDSADPGSIPGTTFSFFFSSTSLTSWLPNCQLNEQLNQHLNEQWLCFLVPVPEQPRFPICQKPMPPAVTASDSFSSLTQYYYAVGS